jgi:hypothetical protein
MFYCKSSIEYFNQNKVVSISLSTPNKNLQKKTRKPKYLRQCFEKKGKKKIYCSFFWIKQVNNQNEAVQCILDQQLD